MKQLLRIKIENIEKLSEDDFNQIASDVKENHCKIFTFEKVLKKVCVESSKTFNDEEYIFRFKDEKHKTCFETQLENMLEQGDTENHFKMTYAKILKLDQDTLNTLLRKIKELAPVEPVVRPVQPVQVANNNNINAAHAGDKKTRKKKKKNPGKNETSAESKPSAVAKAIDSYKGPQIAPQSEKRGLWPKLERGGFCLDSSNRRN